MSKYENYYPTTTCFQDKETLLSKKDSMCEYCYSCYLELCYYFSIKFISCEEIVYDLEIIKDKMKIRKQEYPELYDKYVSIVIRDTIDILNKYTKYSKIKKEGYNKLHISFIENLILTLGPLINIYYSDEENKANYKYTNESLKRFKIYELNIICLEVYCNYHYKTYGIINSITKLYPLVKYK